MKRIIDYIKDLFNKGIKKPKYKVGQVVYFIRKDNVEGIVDGLFQERIISVSCACFPVYRFSQHSADQDHVFSSHQEAYKVLSKYENIEKNKVKSRWAYLDIVNILFEQKKSYNAFFNYFKITSIDSTEFIDERDILNVTFSYEIVNKDIDIRVDWVFDTYVRQHIDPVFEGNKVEYNFIER